jgi:hypothetical protein
MVAFPWGLDRFGECASDHHCVSPASQGLTDVPSLTHPAVGNNRHVPAAPLQVIISGGCTIHRRGDLRYAETQDAPRSASCAWSYADQDSGDPALKNFEGDLKANGISDDNRTAQIFAQFGKI